MGLIVGLMASAGVTADSGTSTMAFVLSAVTVVIVLVLVAVVAGSIRR
ncbi:hypothetical protein AHiyo6_00520 [Arthrobacter sp. Hiyo6]|nr:hypothetical protein AHiyo6_00520 [Arthrobacter sp. Hiyo6]